MIFDDFRQSLTATELQSHAGTRGYVVGRQSAPITVAVSRFVQMLAPQSSMLATVSVLAYFPCHVSALGRLAGNRLGSYACS